MKTRDNIEEELKAAAKERRFTSLTVAGLAVVLVATLVLNFMLWKALITVYPKREYAYTQNAAAVCSFAPLDQPGTVTPALVKNFAERTVAEINSYSYASWRTVLSRVLSSSFTPQARADYKTAFLQSTILASVKRDRLVVATTPQSQRPVEITSSGTVDGIFKWTIRVPLIVVYSDGERYTRENRDFTVEVERVPLTGSNPDGLAIAALFSTQTIEQQAHAGARQ